MQHGGRRRYRFEVVGAAENLVLRATERGPLFIVPGATAPSDQAFQIVNKQVNKGRIWDEHASMRMR